MRASISRTGYRTVASPYRLIYRGIRDAYYCFDTETNKRENHATDNADEAER